METKYKGINLVVVQTQTHSRNKLRRFNSLSTGDLLFSIVTAHE